MSKAIQVLSMLATCFVFNINLAADIYIDLNQCVKLPDPTARLSCFDLVSKNYQLQIKSDENLVQKNHDDNSSYSKSVNSSLVSQPSSERQRPIVKQSKKAVFGLKIKETEPEKEEEVISIQSQLVGQFTSWKKGMKLVLENGQVWKVTKAGSGYNKIMNPNIKILKGFFGTFNASIEGISSQAKVRRIK